MVLVGWLVTGFGAFAGSILGNAAGSTGLKVGAIVGGILGVVLSSRLAIRWSWIPASRGFAALLGGLAGFAVAVPLTLNNMGSPVVPVLSCALAGVGMLAGSRFARS
jgi:hypothetical protein